jgi:hypothetical protein
VPPSAGKASQAERSAARYGMPSRPEERQTEERTMVTTSAQSPDEYLDSLPPDRREAMRTVREVVNRNLPPGFEEGMQYGMIGWYVPLDRFPDTYNGQPLGLAGLASQKQYMSLYLNTVYGDPATESWFRERYAAAGKRLDMGKSCVRFRRLDDLALDVIGATIARADLDAYVAAYQAVRGSSRRRRAATPAPAAEGASAPSNR